MLKKFFVFLLSFALCFIPVIALAQQGLVLSQVDVDLWPEFDQPSMLVIYHITLPEQSSLPASMSLRIPAAVGAPNAVAVKQKDGALISIPYTQETDGDWSRLDFQATEREVQIEFYDPSLQKNGDQRHYEYTWPGDYAVEAFKIQVQQPVGATEMHIKPGTVSATQGDDNLMYYQMNVGSLSSGQQVQITVDYTKSTDELSASNIPVEPSGPLNDSNAGFNIMSNLPWFLGGLGLIFILGGIIWYWLSGRQKGRPNRELHRRNRPAESPTAENVDSGYIYCHQCGKRAAAGDRFCRTCGTELRVS
jgi:hypothetical protein